MVALFLVDGFEEIEALATVDILRRGGAELVTVSLMNSYGVTGSHGIEVKADRIFEEIIDLDFKMLILPGGPGTYRYNEHTRFLHLLKTAESTGKYIAAICAAPTILGGLGMLTDKRAVCYPGMEDKLFAKEVGDERVVLDGKIITSRAAGTTFEFSLKLLKILFGDKIAEDVSKSILKWR